MATTENSNGGKVTTILAILLTVSLIGNALLYINRTTDFPSKKELAIENTMLNKQLVQHKNELNKFRGISGKIDNVVADAQIKIEEKEKIILQLKKDKKWTERKNQELTFQIDSLKENYLNVIDSFLVEREYSKAIKAKIGSLEETIAELKKDIAVGSWLVGGNLYVTPLKSTLGGKKKTTAIAKKTEEIKICIDIMNNRLSTKGQKNLYVVITTPNGQTLYQGEGNAPTFNNPDFKKESQCSKIETIDYQNQNINVCTSIEINRPLNTGLYILEVFTNDSKIGMTVFSLK